MKKFLNTKNALLNKNDLEEYLAKFASDNIIKDTSNKETYPIPRVKENCKYISLVYTLLNEHLKIGIPIHPAGEWILDNFYIIEKSAKEIEKALPLSKYVKFPGILQSGFARIFVLANEIVSNTDGKIEKNDLKDYLVAYQTQKNLTMEEIWCTPVFLQICIIEKIRHICERIFVSQMEKCKVENIIERIIENKPGKQIKISVNGAYPFIEYMSYRLKKYGKEGIPYLDAFEEQVDKMGMTITDAINREHFDIAVRKLSMKNAVTSIRNISRLNMVSIFKEINVVENILNKDPANVYQNMDYDSKDFYRNKILEISKKTKISEIYIAEEVLKLCEKNKQSISGLGDEQSTNGLSDEHNELNYNNENNKLNYSANINDYNELELKKCHVGYYLIDDGKDELISSLLNKNVKSITSDQKAKLYVFTIYFFTILSTVLLLVPTKFVSILLFIPIQNSVTKIVQYVLGKRVKKSHIPKIDLQNHIPVELSTMCVVPVYLKSEEDVKDIFRKMEVYYLANKSENLFFTLLGDCTTSNMQDEAEDKNIVKEGLKQVKRLNEKYGEIFFFTYRKREWSESERCYMGWERKRGMINQFNEFLITGKSKFEVNTCKVGAIPKIKYVITIDSDTNLVMDSAFKLIGAMSHILNKPEIDKIKNVVVKGHGIIQPRVNLEIDRSRESLFTRLISVDTGIDPYSSAFYDVYQDTFDEGIFTGKGIYDLDVFYEVLKDTIPENKVLSHDLLEGSFLRCGLANDIYVMDGQPSSYNTYKIRKHRWIRGDIQIIGWLNSSLNFLSKYKILDNIVRSLNEVFLLLVLFIGMITNNKLNIALPFIILSVSLRIGIWDIFINTKGGKSHKKLFAPTFSQLQKIIYKYVLDVILLPDNANVEANAFIKSIYRLKVSHINLLEWTTAKEAESKNKASIKDYYVSMIFSVISGILFLKYPFSLLWIFSPLIMYLMSKREERRTSKLSVQNKKYLLRIGEKTWKYFKENMTNYLVNDNYQEEKRIPCTKRTSPTNIGLEILAIISSYDLGYETEEYVIELLENVINTIETLPKWNGHLFNWYDTEKLVQIYPLIISTVDSGNFVGYLYTLKQFLVEHLENEDTKVFSLLQNKKQTTSYKKLKVEKERIKNLIEKVDKLINDTDFSALYDDRQELFSIGYNVEENKLIDYYYDLLASESRQTTLVAIAKNDIPSKSWNALGRTLTSLKGHIGLVSWGGTTFEYLMTNLIIPTYDATLIDESCKFLILSQKEYALKLGIPWGISESSYNLKDFDGNYQYKTFGIPWLGIKRGLESDIVVSPYSTALALTECPKDAINNLKRLEKEGAFGKYGFYDAIDYTQSKEIIKIFMAHHQGMILSAIDNQLMNNIFQKRFMQNPEIEGIKVLLQETMPTNIILTKEKKEKTQKNKDRNNDEYSVRNTGLNVISTSKYSSITYENGYEYNKIDDVVLTDENNIYIKDIDTKNVWSFVNSKKETAFTLYSNEFKLNTGNFRTTVNTTIASDLQVEVKEISITNKGLNDLNLEVTTSAKPILTSKKQYDSHPAFENMFLNFENTDDYLVVSRNKKMDNEHKPYLVTSLFSEEGSTEFEIDKEKFVERKNNGVPDSVLKSYPFSKKEGNVINSVIAMRKIISVKPNETKKIYLISSADYDKDTAIKNFKEYRNIKNLNRLFELSKVQTEAEIKYLGLKNKQIQTYQKMLKFLLLPNDIAIEKESNIKNLSLDISNEKIWKYGISGDFPILLVNIKDLNDYYVVEEVFEAYEFFRSRNVKIEIAITSKKDIMDNIKDSNIKKYLNQKEGIFVLNDLSREEKKVLELRANLIIDAHNGSLKKQIDELDDSIETEVFENSETLEDNQNEVEPIVKVKDLKFYNGYGGFNEDGSEYYIIQDKDNRLPLAWSNVLANKKFGSVVTDSLRRFYMV